MQGVPHTAGIGEVRVLARLLGGEQGISSIIGPRAPLPGRRHPKDPITDSVGLGSGICPGVRWVPWCTVPEGQKLLGSSSYSS